MGHKIWQNFYFIQGDKLLNYDSLVCKHIKPMLSIYTDLIYWSAIQSIESTLVVLPNIIAFICDPLFQLKQQADEHVSQSVKWENFILSSRKKGFVRTVSLP